MGVWLGRSLPLARSPNSQNLRFWLTPDEHCLTDGHLLGSAVLGAVHSLDCATRNCRATNVDLQLQTPICATIIREVPTGCDSVQPAPTPSSARPPPQTCRMMRRHEHCDLLMAYGTAEHMACTGPGSSAKQARHDLNTFNTTFGTERAGRPLHGSSGFSVVRMSRRTLLPSLRRHHAPNRGAASYRDSEASAGRIRRSRRRVVRGLPRHP